jgi:hypothetical protein
MLEYDVSVKELVYSEIHLHHYPSSWESAHLHEHPKLARFKRAFCPRNPCKNKGTNLKT